jgi:hypothetical protein
MTNSRWFVATLIAVVVPSLAFAKTPVFAIYLVSRDASRLDQVQLADTPLLTEREILEYRWPDHTMTLTREGLSRLPTSSAVGVRGKPFVVVADGRRCYRGALWTSLSSLATDQPVIDVLARRGTKVRMQCGYPEHPCFPASDVRNSPSVRRALARVGKLVGY